MAHHLAQVNVAYARGGPADAVMAPFNALLDELNLLAERSPGFVWRYITDSRDPLQRELRDPLALFNMSVWENLDALHAFTYRTMHGKVFAARKKWFADWKDSVARLAELGEGAPAVALWWVSCGHIPTAAEGIGKLKLLAERGPTAQAFTFKQAFSPDGKSLER